MRPSSSRPSDARAPRALVLIAACAAMLALGAPAATAAPDPPGCPAADPISNTAGACTAEPEPVPTLDPEWSAQFVPPPEPPMHAAAALCLPVDVVFYAQTDWLRLAQKLRANPSACANYYVSIPPLAGDKTALRANQAAPIRALGPQMHAMAEINVTGWSSWVAAVSTRTWFAAGVEARNRMKTAGFDVNAGDIWAVNEFSSAVRQGAGNARQNMRELVRGLYTGDGTTPPVRGLIWVAGMSQATINLSVYQPNVERWMGDGPFWDDMSQFVRFFSQEVYGSIMNWAVPGTTAQERLGPTVDYVEHYGILAGQAPAALSAMSAYLGQSDAPTANAAWPRTAYGWPAAASTPPYTAVQAYVAAQVYALRHYQNGRAPQTWGFAWNPQNFVLPDPIILDFTNKTALVLERLAAAIHASDTPTPDPGIGACGVDLAWCAADIDGASFNTVWQLFHTWTPDASDSSTTVQQNDTSAIALNAKDSYGAPLTYLIVDQPLHGTVTVEGTGPTATYTPTPGYYGPDSFTFKATAALVDSRIATVSVTVNAAPIADAGRDVSATWGIPVTLTGAATDPDTPKSMQLTGSWDFGDGSTAAGFVTSHTYADPGTYVATLTVHDADGGVGSDTAIVTVGPRAATLTSVTPAALDRHSVIVGVLLGDAADAGSARLEHHDVTIGIGASTCSATTDATGLARCTLDGTSLPLGPATITARFDGDALYAAASTTAQVVLYVLPAAGMFAVGDLSASGTVTFWSPSWWRENSLSGGSAPASFKGFVQPSGSGWTASPGFGHAPATVPEWMGVVVTTTVTKDEPTITGDTRRIVVVHVDAYDHALGGRGTVVAAAG